MDTIEVLTVVLSVVGTVCGVAALGLHASRYRLEQQRRTDALFDRRFEYYQHVRKIWLNTHAQAGESRRPLDAEDWLAIAEESEFLFGPNIHDHLVALADKQHDGLLDVPNEDFIEPFRAYLRLR